MIKPYQTKSSYKWVVLAISFLLMATFAISLQFLPPLFDQIARDIPFSNTQAGMLMGAYAIPGVFIPFLIAFLAHKFNQKMIIIIALSVMIAGLAAFSLSGSFYTLLAFRLVSGIGATVLVVLAPLIITMFFDQKNIGVAMGVFNAAVPFGTVVAANLFGVLGQLIRWRLIALGIALFVGVVLVANLFILDLPKSKINKNLDGPQKKPQRMFKMGAGMWLIAAIWTLANTQLLAYITFGPQYFQSVGVSFQSAGLLTSLIMMVPIFLSPLAGIIIDRTGRTRQILLAGGLMMAVSFLLISKTTVPLALWAVILGVGFTPIPVVVYSLLPQMVRPHQVGAGLGVLTVASNLGITIGPAAFGLLLDITKGNFFTGFIALAFVSAGIIIIKLGLRREFQWAEKKIF